MKLSYSLFIASAAANLPTGVSQGLRGMALSGPVTACSADSPCGECRGHCESDVDCGEGLVCFAKNGAGIVPGCRGFDNSKTNWCIRQQDCSEPKMAMFPDYGEDSEQRMLHRHGLIDEIPTDVCNPETGKTQKNVILVIGDGMGWEMIRAGAIARQVIDELEGLGCDTKVGCPDLDTVDGVFTGRTLSDYYLEGKGSGLSFQDLPGYALVTTSAPVIQEAEDGNHYAPSRTLLNGPASAHFDRQEELFADECGFPYEFNPLPVDDGGNMALWDNEKGGEFPWDVRYYEENPDTSGGFDPTFIMQHGTDSASTAGAFATGVKGARGQLSQDLYEVEKRTIIEEAMKCGKAGGVVTSVPMFHATPGAFIIHSNNRSNRDQLRTSWKEVNPTFISGVCGGRYYPYPEDLEAIRSGYLSSQWTLFEQNNMTMAEDFYNGIEDLDPDDGSKVLVCLGGDFTPSGEQNLPYRGVDSTFANRWCSSADIDEDDGTVAIDVNSEICNHYTPEELKHIPKIQDNVMAAIEFLSKDDDGFFLMYEQGDIDWAAHANHMDDLLGAMLDIDDSVRSIMNWIDENGGYEKNALYVTADHDHYLTLNDHFPEALATFLINGDSHNITPQNNSNINAWAAAITAGLHQNDGLTQKEALDIISSWTEEELEQVAHFWGPRGSGGNGWGSHSSRPVPLSYDGDDGCIEQLMGAPYRVVGKQVQGSKGKVDHVHVHACMYKNLFGL